MIKSIQNDITLATPLGSSFQPNDLINRALPKLLKNKFKLGLERFLYIP